MIYYATLKQVSYLEVKVRYNYPENRELLEKLYQALEMMDYD